MSGIVGIINLDGAPVDRELLERMTNFMSFRGPDAQDIWIDGHVGFGHTMLRTTEESLNEKQPCSLDGKVWITPDARVDARADLIRKLESKGNKKFMSVTDAELILHAYHTWGEHCVKYLMGDFAFAIWDGPQQRLFCARDHFGVKPFYYAPLKDCLIFSNTLNCVRIHPAVSDELNDLAIADFLLFALNQDPATTTFADIQRLPPAHILGYAKEALYVNRYWTLPTKDTIYYKRSDEYVEHFRDVLRTAVKDRLRTDHVGVFMSGGLDSPGVAATAHQLLSKQKTSPGLRAYTVVYDRLIPDEERYYSGLVASALGIPIHYLVADDYDLYERWDQPQICTPEPCHEPTGLAISFDLLKEISSDVRVAFYAEGPDNLLHYEWQPYIFHLIKSLQIKRLFVDVAFYILSQRRLPFLPGIPRRLKSLIYNRRAGSRFPKWFSKDLALRLDLSKRWKEVNQRCRADHSLRPVAYDSLGSPLWQSLFEGYDPGVTSFPLEVRYPFMDLRMVQYLLAVPPIPWCCKKYLLRSAFKGALPEAILRRGKSPLASDPVFERAANSGVPQPIFTQEITTYVDPELVPVGVDGGADGFWVNVRPLSLNQWFQYSYQFRTILKGGTESHEERK